MKLLSDDPRFTSWLLGELPAEEAAEISRQVAADPALSLAARQSQQYHQQLSQLFSQHEPSLHPLQREKILAATRRNETTPTLYSKSTQRSYTGWWIGAAAAAAIVLGILLQGNQPTNQPTDSIAREISLLPVDGGANPTHTSDRNSVNQVGGVSSEVIMPPDAIRGASANDFLQRLALDIASTPLPLASELPQQSLRHFLSSSSHPQATLPLQAGDSSWKWISRSIVEKNVIPAPQMIRIEEMVNAFPQADAPTLAATAAPAPHHTSRQWIFIRIHNDTAQTQNAKLTYIAPVDVRYRLVGFQSARSINTGSTEQIPANTQTTLLLEIDQATSSDLGSLQLAMAGKIKNLPLRSETPDTHHRHLACMAAFGMLLGGPSLDPHYQSIDPALIGKEISALEAHVASPRILSSLAILRKGISMIESNR